MTQGFYEQLGVDPAASVAEIRTSYARVVAQLVRRRKAVVEQGGDTSPLDLARSQADEAWRVQNDRYNGGLASYLDVLSAEDYLLANLRAQSDLRSRSMTLDVALNRALGGGYRNL